MHTARIQLQGMLRPDGHTISVSDLFFIAHHLGMMVSATESRICKQVHTSRALFVCAGG